MERGAIVLVPADAEPPDVSNGAILLDDNPRAAFAKVLSRFFVETPSPGIAQTAVIAEDARIHPTAHVGEFTVVRSGVVIGRGAEIRDHVVIGRGVHVGEGSLVKSHAVLGEEGFGIETDENGNNFPVPQIGSVRIGAHVQVGNFTTVCSGALEPTIVEDYVKLSDHVHVAHNCRVGKNSLLTAGVVLAGGADIGEDVWLGPGTTVRDSVSVGDGAFIGIGSNVVRSIPSGETWAGNPARRMGQ